MFALTDAAGARAAAVVRVQTAATVDAQHAATSAASAVLPVLGGGHVPRHAAAVGALLGGKNIRG